MKWEHEDYERKFDFLRGLEVIVFVTNLLNLKNYYFDRKLHFRF